MANSLLPASCGLVLLCLMIPLACAGPTFSGPSAPNVLAIEAASEHALMPTEGLEISSAGEAVDPRNDLLDLTSPESEDWLSAEEASALNALNLLGDSFQTDPDVDFGSSALPKELFPDIPEQRRAENTSGPPALVEEEHATRSMADFFQEATKSGPNQGSNAWAAGVSSSWGPRASGHRRSTMLVQMLSGYRGGTPPEPTAPAAPFSFGVNLLKKGRVVVVDEL